MAKSVKKELSLEEQTLLLDLLKIRFDENRTRHPDMDWSKIQIKLEVNSQKVWSLFEMEKTGGEPDVVAYDEKTDKFLFYDCAAETPKERRSFCYDREALDSRKENKPKNNAMEVAAAMGIEILDEEQYRYLQKLGQFDTKTSSWIKTPDNIRQLGGALFADFRYDTVFIYHNGASSYYAGRGFRGVLRV